MSQLCSKKEMLFIFGLYVSLGALLGAACGVQGPKGYYDLSQVPTASLSLVQLINGLPGSTVDVTVSLCRNTNHVPNASEAPCQPTGNVNQYLRNGGGCEIAYGPSISEPPAWKIDATGSAFVVFPDLSFRGWSAKVVIECGGISNALEARTFSTSGNGNGGYKSEFRFFTQVMCTPTTMSPGETLSPMATPIPYPPAPTFAPPTPKSIHSSRCFNQSCVDCREHIMQSGCQVTGSSTSISRQCSGQELNHQRLRVTTFFASVSCSGNGPHSTEEFEIGKCYDEVTGSFTINRC